MIGDERTVSEPFRELTAIENRLLQLLIVNAYANWSSCLHGCGAPITKSRHEFFKDLRPGHLVMEHTSLHLKDYHRYRIGTLLTDQREPYGTDEWWEQNKEDYDGVRPTERNPEPPGPGISPVVPMFTSPVEAAHRSALSHGLPEIPGYYGIDLRTGEFVSV